MEMNEFLERPAEEPAETEDLDVQKAVVESLAADKAEQDERINALLRENNELKSKITELSAKIDEMKSSLAKVGDVLAANAEGESSSKIALLDRDTEQKDRFPGESRDHVIETLKEAFAAAEKDGRLRRAQILESVLLANQPSGTLAQKRAELTKLFNENANVINGTVMNALQKLGIPFKNGEDYLLTTEILKRTY